MFSPLTSPIDFLITLMISETVGLIFFALYYLIFKDRDKHFFLYFDTDKSCSLIAKKVEDGFATFKKKYFYVDTAKPIMFFRSFGFQNPLLFLKWSDMIPIDVIRKTVNLYLTTNDDVNLTDSSLSIDRELKEEIQSEPDFIDGLKDHAKSIIKTPDELSGLEKETFDRLIKHDKKLEQSYHLREKLTPEVLKDVIDSKIASNLLKPLTSIDMLMYIVIGLAVGFLLCISLMAMGILPKV